MWIMAQNGSLINLAKYDCVKVVSDNTTNKFRVVICRDNEIEFVGEYDEKTDAQAAVYELTDKLEERENIFDMPADIQVEKVVDSKTIPVKNISLISCYDFNDSVDVSFNEGQVCKKTFQGVKSITLNFEDKEDL